MRWLERAGALIVGALPALAFPQAAQWWLGFVGLVPLLLVIRAAPSSREAALRTWLGGMGFVIAVHYWVIPNVGLFVVPIGLFLGGFLVPWGLLGWSLLRLPLSTSRFALALVLLPSAWVAAEFVWSWDRLGGPFGLLGSTQWNDLPELSLAAVGGVWAVSFVLAAANVAMTTAVLPRVTARLRIGALIAVFGIVAVGPVYALLRRELPTVRTVHVAGVQPGVIRPVVPRFEASNRATLALPRGRFDLVVWGESSVGLDPERHLEYLRSMSATSKTIGADLVANVDARVGSSGILKQSVLVGPDGVHGRYDKMRLVPFGEYIPLRPIFGWVELITRAPAQDRHRGGRLVLFDARGMKIGPLICFESAFPDMTRHLTRMGADLILIQSSDSTFQDSWEPAQHASVAAVRAVETGRPVLQATLTGVSAAFDAEGHQLLWFDTGHRGLYTVTIPLTRGTTWFVRFGDWVPAGCFALLLGSAPLAGLIALRRRQGAEAP
jgi:apolipoprotein N-acyltransferase